jgi:hypothetical protein
MPIKPKNVTRYPANWKALRAAVLDRAGNRCEQCGVPNYALVQTVDGKRNYAYGNLYYDDFQYTGSYAEAAAARDVLNYGDDAPFVVIVLTIAHLDHDELETQDISRLRAWCQKCHLTYDAQHHAQNARATRHARKACGELF